MQVNALQTAGYTPHIIPISEQETIAEMVEFTKELIEKPAPIIGFSMGGIIALALLKSNPELIDSLCLISSNCLADKPERLAIRLKQIHQAQQTSLTDVLNKDFLPHYFYQSKHTDSQLVLNMANELGLNAFSAQLHALATREDTLKVIEKTDKKLLFIGGEQDPLCASDVQKMMHSACPNSDLILLGQCGHFVPLERSNTLNTLLLDWLGAAQ
nr:MULTISPECIES: alpha/beta hydrolase [unclassified Pseudoalteromonas]